MICPHCCQTQLIFQTPQKQNIHIKTQEIGTFSSSFGKSFGCLMGILLFIIIISLPYTIIPTLTTTTKTENKITTKYIKKGDTIFSDENTSITMQNYGISKIPANTEEEFLWIKIRIRNISQNKTINYTSWNNYTTKLEDAFENKLNIQNNTNEEITIQPKKFTEDILIFEKPTTNTPFLTLTLPLQNIQKNNKISIKFSPKDT